MNINDFNINELIKQSKEVREQMNIKDKSSSEKSDSLDFIQKTLLAIEKDDNIQDKEMMETFKSNFGESLFKDDPEMMKIYKQQSEKSSSELIKELKDSGLDLDPLALLDKFFEENSKSKQVFESQGVKFSAEDMQLIYEEMKNRHQKDINPDYE